MKKILFITKLLFGWPFSILALFFIGRLILSKSGAVLPGLKDLNPSLLVLAVICFLCYFFLRSYFWKKVLKEKGHNLPLKEVAYLWSQAEIKRYVPGNIWSFLGRTTLFSDRGVEKRNIFSSLFLEIQFFLLAAFLLSIFSFSFVFYNLLPSFLPFSLIVYRTAALIILISILFVFNTPLRKAIKAPLFLNHLLPNFPPETNFSLLLVAIAYMFFYGLGTYFAMSSVLVLSPFYLLTFLSFFVFAFLVGYLSLITPTGLGVREAVLTFGLSKFIPLSLAGFGAIFARVVLVASEVIFLFSAYLWSKTKNTFILRLEQIVKPSRFEFLLGFLILIYIAYFTMASFLRYENFYTGRFDLGNMDQTVWNTSQGRIFQLTDPNGTEIISRLAFHADFILILLTPFYKIWPDPRTLLFLQSLILGFGALFVFLIAQKILENKKLAFVFSFTYLINPSLNHANLYDFHAVTLATTFLLGAIYFFLKRKNFLFLVFALLAGLTKEQVWIIISFFGLYLLTRTIIEAIKKRSLTKNLLLGELFGVLLFTASIAIFFYLIWVAIPSARGQNHFALSYYSDFGATPASIIKNIILSPQKTFSLLVENERLSYLFALFAPLGFLSVLSPAFLVFAVPDLTINLLSNNSGLHQIYFHYSSTITPFLFVAAIFAVKNLQKLFLKISQNFLIGYLLIVGLWSAYSFGPLPGAKNPNLDMFLKPQPNKELINDFLMRIPEKYSIAATNNLGSHLSHRQKIFTIPVGVDKADIVIFLLNDQFAQPSLTAQIEMAKDLKKNKNYIKIFEQGELVVFKKKTFKDGFEFFAD